MTIPFKDVVIIRIEELYPFPAESLNAVLVKYKNASELIWCQEEPKNQGAWDFAKLRMPAMLDRNWNLHYVGRQSSSAPAVGSAKLHAVQQAELVERAVLFEYE